MYTIIEIFKLICFIQQILGLGSKDVKYVAWFGISHIKWCQNDAIYHDVV